MPMFQGLQRGLAAQPMPQAGGPMPGNMPGGMPKGGPQGPMPPMGARPPMPMPAGPGGQAPQQNPWQGMGNGWLQALRGMGQQMQAQPQGAPDPTIRGPQAMAAQGQGRPDPVQAQAQATDQQAAAIAQAQRRGLVPPGGGGGGGMRGY